MMSFPNIHLAPRLINNVLSKLIEEPSILGGVPVFSRENKKPIEISASVNPDEFFSANRPTLNCFFPICIVPLIKVPVVTISEEILI